MRILFAYDGSGNSRFALGDLRTAGLPEKAEVIIISISEVRLSPKTKQIEDNPNLDRDITEYFQKHSEQSDRNLEEIKQILLEAEIKLKEYFPNWKVKSEIFSGSAADLILSKTTGFKPDLIVIGAQGLSWDNTERLGSISNKVLAEAKCSVRIARTKSEINPEHLKIAICFDGSPGSVEAIKTVASRRSWLGKVEIRLITVTDLLIALIPGRVFRVIPGLPEGQMAGEKKWVESLAEEGLQILRTAGLSAALHIYSGNPRLVLGNETRIWGADLIFVGANYSLSQNSSLGCTASAIAARASCTVEVVRKT